MITYSNIFFYQASAAQTPQEYFEDPDSLGNYQFVTLKQVMDEMLLQALDDDSYLKNTKRSLMLLQAKRGIKTHVKVAAQVLAIEMTVGDNLAMPLPQDYVDWVRVSVVDDDFRLQPLNINRNLNKAIGYLQDNDAQILFDNNGQILTADSANNYAHPYKKYAFCDDIQGGYSELDTSKLSRWGEFDIDEARGQILFSSDLRDKEFVIEYFSDGMEWSTLREEEVKIHKQLEETIKEWIYYACIQYKRNVPQSEKDRALRRYKTVLHHAKIDRSNFDLLQIAREVSVASKLL
jgi:hypothetical protein